MGIVLFIVMYDLRLNNDLSVGLDSSACAYVRDLRYCYGNDSSIARVTCLRRSTALQVIVELGIK